MKNLRKVLFLVLALALIIGTLVVVTSAADDPQYVAAIGEQGYATLKDAIQAAKDGETVKLLANVVADKTCYLREGANVTLDMNGKTISYTHLNIDDGNDNNDDSYLFYPNEGTTFSIVGNGTIRSGYGSVVYVDKAGVTVNLGDGVNTLTVNDQNGPTNASKVLFGQTTGNFNMKKVNVTILNKTVGSATLQFGDAVVRIDDCDIRRMTCGGGNLINFESTASWALGKKIDFIATNSSIRAGVNPGDFAINDNDKINASKGILVHLPGYTAGNATHIGVATGSVLKFVNCTVESKWRGLVQDQGTAYPQDMLTAEFDNCVYIQGAIDGGRAFARRVNVAFNNCKFDDFYLDNGFQFGPSDGHTTFTGVTQGKYGTLSINYGVKEGGTTWPEGMKVNYVKGDTTGYPYHFSNETFEAGETIAFNTLVNLNFTVNSYNANAGGMQFGSKINVAHKNGKKTDYTSTRLTGSELAVTANATNRYFRWYANGDLQAMGAQDSYMDFIVDPGQGAKGSTTGQYPFDQYQYYTWDFDFMTDTRYIQNLGCNVIGRNKDQSPATGNATLFRVEKDSKGESYFKFNGQTLSVGKEAYSWHHITVLINVVSANENNTASAINLRTYVDGKPIGAVYTGTTGAASVLYINGFRFTLGTDSIGQYGDAICMDNVTVRIFDRVPAEQDTLACFFKDDNTTLVEGGYVGYNAQYQLPETSPVAKVGSSIYPTLGEAYAFARDNGGDITLLRNTSEAVDIEAEVNLYPNGIDYVPTDDSWGFERIGEGENLHYSFTEALNEGVMVFWVPNVFDEDELNIVETNFKGGRRVAPTEDVNPLGSYGTLNDDGSVTLYTLCGWADELGGEAIELPIVTSATEVMFLYPAYTAQTIAKEDLAYYATASVPLVFNPEEDPVPTELVVYAGTNLDDLTMIVSSNKIDNITYVMTKDYVTSLGTLLNFNQAVTSTFDLNGHKIIHSPDAKYWTFQAAGESNLIITSSQPGAVIENRPTVQGGSGTFSVGNTATLTVKGENNLIVRALIFLEDASNNGTKVTIENTQLSQCAGDSWAMFMVRSTSNMTLNIKGCKIFGVASGQKDLVDIGNGGKSVSNIVVNVENTHFCYEAGDGKGGCIVSRFPASAEINLKAVTGNYFPRSSQTGDGLHNGKITIYEGCTFNEALTNMSRYDIVTLADGVVVARNWWVSKGTDTWVKFHDNSDEGETHTLKVDCKVRYGTVKAEDAVNVQWYDTTKTNLLHEEAWVKTTYSGNPDNPGYFYSNAVPCEVTEGNITYNFPNDAWYLDEMDDTTAKISPDMSKKQIKSISGFKQNVKLYSDFQLNLYIPVIEGVEVSVKIGENAVDSSEIRVIDGAKYYIVNVAKNADEAADVVEYTLTLTKDGKTATQTVKTAVALYADALKAVEEGIYEDLATAMLRYAKAAYAYANGTEGMPAILANVEDAEQHAVKAESVMTVDSEIVKGASVALTDKPVLVLTLNGEYEGEVSIKVDEFTLTKEVLVGDKQVAFAEIKLYDMAKTFEVFVGEDSVGSFNLSAYAASLEAEAPEVALVDALYDYIAAAELYMAE